MSLIAMCEDFFSGGVSHLWRAGLDGTVGNFPICNDQHKALFVVEFQHILQYLTLLTIARGPPSKGVASKISPRADVKAAVSSAMK